MMFTLMDGATTASTASGSGSGSWIFTIGYIVIIVVAMYFLMIRPQKKKQKAEEKMRNDVRVGDEIITIGGFYARVISIKDDTLTIESPVDHSKQTVAKWAVQQNLTIHDDAAPATGKAKKDKKEKEEKK